MKVFLSKNTRASDGYQRDVPVEKLINKYFENPGRTSYTVARLEEINAVIERLTALNPEKDSEEWKKLKELQAIKRSQKDGPMIFTGAIDTRNKHIKKRVSKDNVLCHSALNLDLDHEPIEWESLLNILNALPFAYLVHTTFNHRPGNQRYRIYIFLEPEIMDEGTFSTVAQWIEDSYFPGMEFDPAGDRYAQRMFLPRCPMDAEYLMQYDLTKPPLNYYRIPEDQFSQAALKAEQRGKKSRSTKGTRIRSQKGAEPSNYEDPCQSQIKAKAALCKQYSLKEGLDNWLGHAYIEASEDRYTYVDSTSDIPGLILKDRNICFSHHTSDPAHIEVNGSLKPLSLYELMLIHGKDQNGVPFDNDTKRLNTFLIREVGVFRKKRGYRYPAPSQNKT